MSLALVSAAKKSAPRAARGVVRTFAVIDTQGSDPTLVERPAPGRAPTAFRLWKAGENDSDEGPVYFTRESAAKLMAEQDARGRVYSSDFDHLSVVADRPATSGRASGWHKLALRTDAAGEPELWAVDIEWCDDARAGLEADPPHWRFFSPAFRRDDDGEITSYVNFALCINPLTHGLPSLMSEKPQSKKETSMTKNEAAEHIAKLGDISAGEDERKASAKALAEFLDGLPEDDEKPAEVETGKDKEKVVEEKAAAPMEKRSDGDGDETVEKKAVLAMAADFTAMKKEVEALKVTELLTARPDLPESVRTWCAGQPFATVKSFLQSSPAKPAAGKRPSAPTQGDEAGKPVGLQGHELETLNAQMGIRKAPDQRFERTPEGGLRMHAVGPSRARELAQQKAGSK